MVMGRVGSPMSAVVPGRVVRVGRIVVRVGVPGPSVSNVAAVAGRSPASGRRGTGGATGGGARGGSTETEGAERNGAGGGRRSKAKKEGKRVKQKREGTRGIGWVFPGV